MVVLPELQSRVVMTACTCLSPLSCYVKYTNIVVPV